jgi:hypothetical protein
MTRVPSRIAGLIITLTAVAGATTRAQPSSTEPARPAWTPRETLTRYCVTCHNDRLKTAGLSIAALDPDDVAPQADVWEKIVRKLRAGVMPPAGRPRPDKQAYTNLVGHLESHLDRAAAAAPDPGRPDTFHRLNRSEYQNAIRDLLALDIDVSALLPNDDATFGFDNIASALKMSPTLMERYLAAARKISRAAVGAAPGGPAIDTYRMAPDASQEAHVEGLPLGTRGGALIRHTFLQDGEYAIKAKLALDTQDNVPRYDEPHQLEISIEGTRLGLFTLEPEPDSDEIKRKANDDFRQAGFRRNIDAEWQVQVAVKAGLHDVAVTFLEKPAAELDAVRPGAFRPLRLALKQPFARRYIGGYFNDETRSGPYLGSVTISGPFNSSGPGDTPSRRRIFICKPSTTADERTCARAILAGLARRAYRREVTDEDLRDLLAFFDRGRTGGGFESGVELALRRMLVKPAFLFRIERDPANVSPRTAYRLTDVELASRLSFFLWSSIPDDALLDAARNGQLARRDVLEQQVHRMLADRRLQSLVANFTGQWLYLRNLPTVTPDQRLFPDFDGELRQAFRRETELFFESVLREDRSALDLLRADYTFLNEPLARHYGIPGVRGDQFRRVTLVDDNRRGLLGQASILATTSYPHRTSPVVRGKWILDNLLGTPPPPPPPNVPDLKDTNGEGKVLSMRDRMVQHRANPACASCHSMMDPAGFALENFDAVGRQRSLGESSTPIDASGELPDGRRFTGAAGLRNALLTEPEAFVTRLTEKLLIYALGRGLEYYDAPAVRAIVRDARSSDYRMSALVLGIVKSLPFQMRRSADPVVAATNNLPSASPADSR